VALTGSDTASNVLFGSLQTITAKHLASTRCSLAAANSSGGVMGKWLMPKASSWPAPRQMVWTGRKDPSLRLLHSLALAA